MREVQKQKMPTLIRLSLRQIGSILYGIILKPAFIIDDCLYFYIFIYLLIYIFSFTSECVLQNYVF